MSPEILDRVRRDAARIPVGRRVGKPGIGQDAIHKLLIEAAKSGQRAVRLKGGDPFIFGRGGEEIEALRAAGVAYSVVPGITAGLGAAAQFEAPLTYRHEALRITFLTAHKARDAETVDWSVLTDKKMTIVVYMGMTAAPSVRAGLLGRRPVAANARRRIRAGDAAGCAGRGRHAREIFPRWSKKSMAVPPSSSSATSSRIPRRGASPTSIKSSPNCWMLPNDLSASTEKIKITGPSMVTANRTSDGVVIYRTAQQGWSASLSDAAIVRTSDEARALLAEANADDVGAVGAYIAPVELKDSGEIKPGNLREHIRSKGLTIDLLPA